MLDWSVARTTFEAIAQTVCLCALPVVVSALVIVWLNERGTHPFRFVFCLFRRSLFEAVLILSMVGAALHTAATKSTNEVDGVNAPRRSSVLLPMETLSLPEAWPVADDPLPAYTNDITNLCFTGILPSTNSVFLGIGCPADDMPPLSLVDIYAMQNLVSNEWSAVATTWFPSGTNRTAVELSYSILPSGWTNSMFFILGTCADTDGDGLTDAFERLVAKTDPAVTDTDEDGMPDGWEFEHGMDPLSDDAAGDADSDGLSNLDEYRLGTNPTVGDTDGDGLDDGLETGGIRVLDSFIWKDTSDLPVSYGWPPPSGLSSYFSTVSLSQFPEPITLNCREYNYAYAADNGCVVLLPYDPGWYGYPGWRRPLNYPCYDYGLLGIAPYWSAISLCYGDTNSYMRAGCLADGSYVAEYHDVRQGMYYSSSTGMTFQVIVPGGTGQVVYVSYKASDFPLAEYDAVIGVQDASIIDLDGCWNLSWDFACDGDIVPPVTIEYRFCLGTDPLSADTDGDGLSDGDEYLTYFSNPFFRDTDGDGIEDGQEVRIGTSPTDPDTDGDGLPDAWEVAHGLDPLSADGDDGADGDPDGDGLSNIDEYRNGADPNNPDTDGDGESDFFEVSNGMDPCDSEDNSSCYVELPFQLGGDYAAWEMTVRGLGPDDTRTLRFGTSAPHEYLTVTNRLRKGNSYQVSMRWLSSVEDLNNIWYCWSARIGGLPNIQTYNSYNPVRIEGAAETIAGNGWFADNADGLLTAHVHMREPRGGGDPSGGGNVAEGLVATLHIPKAEIAFMDYDDDTWATELPPEKVILSDKPMRIRIRISGGITSFDEAAEILGGSVTVRTSGTAAHGVAIPFGDGDTGTMRNGWFEIHMERTYAQLRALGLLPANDDDGVTEMAWWDNGSDNPTAASNLTDSEAFGQLAAEFRGKATKYGDLNSEPPNSPQHISFFQAAGTEVITASYAGMITARRQIQNQADYFYYSGHGNHKTGTLQGGISPSMIQNRWSQDLDVVIIAGCSVLDIGDFRNQTLKAGTRVKNWWVGRRNTSPGLRWETSGAPILLGYCWKAPLDIKGGTTIARDFVHNLSANMSVIHAWRDANNCPAGRNACAIDCRTTPHCYWFWDDNNGNPIWTSVIKGENSW